LQGAGAALEPQGLARQGDAPIDVEPVLLVTWRPIAHQSALDLRESRLALECPIDFEKPEVDGPLQCIEDHFNDAKAFVDGIEEGTIVGLGELEEAHFPGDRTWYGRGGAQGVMTSRSLQSENARKRRPVPAREELFGSGDG